MPNPEEKKPSNNGVGGFLNHLPDEETPPGPLTSEYGKPLADITATAEAPINRVETQIGPYTAVVETISGPDFAQPNPGGRLQEVIQIVRQAREAFAMWGASYREMLADPDDVLDTVKHHVCTVYRTMSIAGREIKLKATYVMRSREVILLDQNLPGEFTLFQVVLDKEDEVWLQGLPDWLREKPEFKDQTYLVFSRFCAISMPKEQTELFDKLLIDGIKQEMSCIAQLVLHQTVLSETKADQLTITIAPGIRKTAAHPEVEAGKLLFPNAMDTLRKCCPEVMAVQLNRWLKEVIEHMIEYPGYWMNSIPALKTILTDAFAADQTDELWQQVAIVCGIDTQLPGAGPETVVNTLTNLRTMRQLTPLLSIALPFINAHIVDWNEVLAARVSGDNLLIKNLTKQAERETQKLIPEQLINTIEILIQTIFDFNRHLQYAEVGELIKQIALSSEIMAPLATLAMRILIQVDDGPIPVMDSVANWKNDIEKALSAIIEHYRQQIVTANAEQATH